MGVNEHYTKGNQNRTKPNRSETREDKQHHGGCGGAAADALVQACHNVML